MSSTIQLPEDQLIELLLQLRVSLESFTRNAVSTILENSPGPGQGNLKLTTADHICSRCPHGQDGRDRYSHIPGLLHPSLPSTCF